MTSSIPTVQSLQTFCWAAAAFVVGEAVTCYLSLRQTGRVPQCWGIRLYWVIVIPVALGAGAFAVAMGFQTIREAFLAGLTCPFVIQRFMAEQAVPTPRRRRRDA